MIPDKALVGGHNIETIKHTERADLRRADTNLWRNVINVTTDPSLSTNMQEQSYCHELIHQLLSKSGASSMLVNYNKQDDHFDIEEQICCLVENMLWRFLKDNTNFFDGGVK